MRALFLDVDGALNRVGYQPAASAGLRSWIEPELAARLCDVVAATGAQLVMSSDWRVGRELTVLEAELAAAGIACGLAGATPVLGGPRWREIEAYMVQHALQPEAIVIVDDGFDMGPLSSRFVRTSPLAGLDAGAAREIIALY